MDRELEERFYAQVAREIAEKNYQPAPMARAVEKSAGNPDLAKSLYVKFRIEQLVREYDQETRRRQCEAEELAVAERRQAGDRAKAIAEEKITQKKSDQLRQQREAEEAKAARVAKRAEEKAAAQVIKAAELADYNERQAVINDSLLVCSVLVVLCIVSTLFLGWLAIHCLLAGGSGLSVFLLFGLLAIYGITYHHFKARKNRMSEPPSREPSDY